MIFVFLCLIYFPQYDNLLVHFCCCKWYYFILFLWLNNIPLWRFPSGSVVKNLLASAGVSGAWVQRSIPGSERSPGGGNSSPLQYSCLENCMDRAAWRATVQGRKELDTMEHMALEENMNFVLLKESGRMISNNNNNKSERINVTQERALKCRRQKVLEHET